jgi:hypothetical protein
MGLSGTGWRQNTLPGSARIKQKPFVCRVCTPTGIEFVSCAARDKEPLRGIAIEPGALQREQIGIPCVEYLTAGIAARRPIPCFNPNVLTPTERFGLFWLVAE